MTQASLRANLALMWADNRERFYAEFDSRYTNIISLHHARVVGYLPHGSRAKEGEWLTLEPGWQGIQDWQVLEVIEQTDGATQIVVSHRMEG